jgi:hypothetical protein
MGTDLSKAKGLKRVGELLSGSRAKNLDVAHSRAQKRTGVLLKRHIGDMDRRMEHRVEQAFSRPEVMDTATEAQRRARQKWAPQAAKAKEQHTAKVEKAYLRSGQTSVRQGEHQSNLFHEAQQEKDKVFSTRLGTGASAVGAAALGVNTAMKRKKKASRQKKAFAAAVQMIAEGIKAASIANAVKLSALGTIASKASQVGRIGGTMTTNALKAPGVAATAQAINPRRNMTQAIGAFKAR